MDILIYGATGFTGKLVAEHFSQHLGNVRWAMAGRSLDKLAATRDDIGAPADTPIIVADASNPATLEAMVTQARCILTTVGPYQVYGSDLVVACAKHGTDYLDLCGEPAWMRQMIDAHSHAAKASGARIVFSCGFDSIPFDLGVLFLQTHAQKAYGAPLRSVRGRVRTMKGTFSGGTAASFRATMAAAARDPEVLTLLRDPFSLTPGFTGPKQPSGTRPKHEDDLGSWAAPFIMAPINTRNIHRSNMLLGHPYGTDFCYDEMILTGPGDAGEALAKHITSDKSLGSDAGPKPGEGPSKAERESGHYDILFIGESASGQQLKASVTGDKDPGYGSTSKMIAQAAMCLAMECADLAGGIYTPASSMGLDLLGRLETHAGLRFLIEN
ncbi:MAG: saccharopine dehydrogenase NADP-binding domain-containing protein [Pseudomonadota bacterium]